MKRAWQIPDDVRTVHLGGFTPEHGVEIASRLDEAEVAYWAKAPTGFFTRLWERDVHLFVDRTKLERGAGDRSAGDRPGGSARHRP